MEDVDDLFLDDNENEGTVDVSESINHQQVSSSSASQLRSASASVPPSSSAVAGSVIFDDSVGGSSSNMVTSNHQRSYASSLLDNLVGLPSELANESNVPLDDDEVEVSAQEVINQLKTAWFNERFAPDLLESKYELVTCLLDQITSMSKKLDRVTSIIKDSNSASRSTDSDYLRMEIHQLEIHRIRYLVSSYLRLRLRKIEDNVFYLLQQYKSQPPHMYTKMSPDELQFALKLEKLYKSHLQSQVLDKLPAGIRKLEESALAKEPNLNHYVFLKVNQTQKQVLIDENDPDGVVDLNEGTQYLVKYKTISPLVENDSFSLI